VQFIDLAAQQAVLRERIDAAIAGVLDHGKYIMGPRSPSWRPSHEVTTFRNSRHAFVGYYFDTGARADDR